MKKRHPLLRGVVCYFGSSVEISKNFFPRSSNCVEKVPSSLSFRFSFEAPKDIRVFASSSFTEYNSRSPHPEIRWLRNSSVLSISVVRLAYLNKLVKLDCYIFTFVYNKPNGRPQ